ncbi:MAG: glycosyltransferase [Bacteroidetes bacterium]|nr:glycosyltransferase [Bacteroidota bacterium]
MAILKGFFALLRMTRWWVVANSEYQSTPNGVAYLPTRMPTTELFALIAAAISMIVWQVFALRAAYHGTSIRQLRDVSIPQPATYPKLSVIVTARNEERMMEHDLQSLVSLSYPDIEFIVVNDRSSDRTGEIIDRFAKQDERIKPIHISELPDGWLGKVNALNVATAQATGDFFLFTDADIRFEHDVLERAVALCEAEQLDHLSMLPADRSQGDRLLLPLFVLAFGALFLVRTKARHIGKKGSMAFTGVGAFNLVRRSAFERTPGFEWLKMEVIDDGGLGQMLKAHGAHSALLGADGLLSFEWYGDLKEAIKGLEKNAFAGFANYSYFKGIGMVLAMWAIVLLPPVVAIALGSPMLLSVYVFCYFVLPWLVAASMKKTLQTRPLFVALMPVGYFFVSLAVANSVWRVWRDGGIRWRDTFYPLAALRSGKRVRL